MSRVTVEFESTWRAGVAQLYPEATIVVLGRRSNRDNLSAQVNGTEVGRYNRDDNDPPGGWIEGTL
jgi:hypothetical protein